MTGPLRVGTWLDPLTGICHEAAGSRRVHRIGGFCEGDWETRTSCGVWHSGEPIEGMAAVVTCLRCIGRRRPDSVVRGKTADMTYVDEAQDFMLSKVAKETADEIDERIMRDVVGTILGPREPSP